MDWTGFVLLFYKEQRFIFGICPCCGKIFQLIDCAMFFGAKRMRIDELDAVFEKGAEVHEAREDLESKEGDLYGLQDDIEALESEYEEKVQPIIERKYKVEGRKQALTRIRRIDKVFTKKKIDPRDLRLIFDPVEYVAFKGLTDGEEVSSVVFFAKAPLNRIQEKVVKSIARTIRNGDYEFTLIKINDSGAAEYSTLK
ncbi:MAG: Holliday junction resolvase-like protein [Nanoarchaeota archaeon]